MKKDGTKMKIVEIARLLLYLIDCGLYIYTWLFNTGMISLVVYDVDSYFYYCSFHSCKHNSNHSTKRMAFGKMTRKRTENPCLSFSFATIIEFPGRLPTFPNIFPPNIQNLLTFSEMKEKCQVWNGSFKSYFACDKS